MDTELGRISELAGNAEKEATLLQKNWMIWEKDSLNVITDVLPALAPAWAKLKRGSCNRDHAQKIKPF